jgi:hypothetical protein
MHVSPVFNVAGTSASPGLLEAFDGPFASLALPPVLSILSPIKRQDNWI